MSLDHDARYHRQTLLPGIGVEGQTRLGSMHALVVGCGALGSVIVDTLARAGVGTLTIVDRDVVEITNLQRQVLYSENDVEQGMPKAAAARRHVASVNSTVTVHAHVDDFTAGNAERFADGADIILDGLDNFETRYLLNDLAVSTGRPYVYGGAVGTTGLSLTVLPHGRHRRSEPGRIHWSDDDATPCLRCVFPEAPPPGTSPTCDTAGVLGPVVMTVAAYQATQAIKLMTGNLDTVDRSMLSLDLWTNDHHRFTISGARSDECPCCGSGDFEYLSGAATSATTSLCGRQAVQITPPPGQGAMVLDEIAARLAAHGQFVANEHLIRGTFDSVRGDEGEPVELTLFPNGRAIIKGTTEPETARAIYAKYVGS